MDGGLWSPTRWALQGARTPPRCPAMSLSTPSVSSLPLPPPGHVRGSRLLAAGGHPLAAEGGHTPGWMLGRPGTAHSKGRCPPGPSAPAPRPWALSPARPPPWLPAGPPSCPAPAPGPAACCSSRPGPALPRSLSASGVEPSLPFGSPEPRPRPRRAQAHSQGSAGRLGAGSQPGREPRQDSRLRRFPPSSLPRPWESCPCGRWSRALSPEPAPGDPDGAPAQPCPWRLWGVTQGMGVNPAPRGGLT